MQKDKKQKMMVASQFVLKHVYMPLAMSRLSRLELLSSARRHYRAFRSRKSKHDYLVYLQELTGYSSLKTIIRHLSPATEKKHPRKRGCRPILNAEDNLALKELWFAMDQPCGKRFCSMLPECSPLGKATSSLERCQQSTSSSCQQCDSRSGIAPFQDSVLSNRFHRGIDDIERVEIFYG